MALFDFLKKKQNSISDILIPKFCRTNIPSEIESKIDSINWADFETAYGNAENTIPFYLKNLFCSDTSIAMHATHQLWCSLCHQHAFVSTAALPSYDILKIGLLQLNDELKIELLDIFKGFSECTCEKYLTPRTARDWEQEIRHKLISDIKLFEDLAKHSDEGISSFAVEIVDSLKNNV